ncbi:MULTISPECIES: hypothetical protein [unclassified Acinetobacter]|uniref:hypothetical protein n=1 Tax=unclassified Acinetobacter TaxID=196816 RepID=UPI00244C23A8|nr:MULTISPECIES: hypothetical protein [unclassified Acinetobacter]MDH0032109.1 hypothetical protein [Acinetobacter sp. GD04021]MDH0887874.1 hypothetical protein [Acinetobacter sp. GD03873]MDH1081932.1 hypothetical protein [Acinetobacter sp. GD03983]MDH2191190.1 hypothetical protein [Acinetobacter sp. GD03645]MDH2204625.1 hypothetical protein [Acinetobacter sp. GD03647]
MEILNFLLPIHFSPFKIEILPITFFLIIWGLFIFTIIQVYLNAKTENWENNWRGGNRNSKSKGLDAEHGSIMDISNAVATSAERIADIMPGMILIIGLLGTFLGLGLALDKASSILTGANSMSNMDASMTQLMGMLEGLGTKFKTSTWGLLAFILLKVILSKNSYEERRLYWSIEKVKDELDLSRDRKLQEERANNQKIIDCMQNIASQFEKTVQINQNSNKEQLQQLTQFSQGTISAIQKSHEEQISVLKLNNKENIEQIKELSKFSQNTLSAIQLGHTEIIKSQKISIEKFSEKYDQMLIALDTQHNENKYFLSDLVQQGKDTRDAMVSFIEKNEATVTTLGKSAAGMSKAASTMGDSANHLQAVIDSFRINMEQVVSLMKKDLNTTISGMNTSFGQNMTKMSDNLKTSIGDMSTSFKKNMSEMSKGLNTATQDISNAVNSLSGSVDETMKTVTSTINESMELQKKSQGQFTTTVQVLRKEILEMTGLVNKLSEDITNGLKSVSESNRHMISVAKKAENLTQMVDGTFKESLQSIEAVTTLKPALENLAHGIDSQITLLGKIENNTSPEQQKKSNNLLKLGGRK